MAKKNKKRLKGWEQIGDYCTRCDAACCKYFAFEIDEPDDEAELDKVYWFMCHEGVTVFVEDGKWFLQLFNKCRYLLPDGCCGNYDHRPQVCRDYGLDEKDEPNCEFISSDFEYEMEFKTPEAFRIYKDAFLQALDDYEEKKKKKKKKKDISASAHAAAKDSCSSKTAAKKKKKKKGVAK
jgi:uncharacterized protein